MTERSPHSDAEAPTARWSPAFLAALATAAVPGLDAVAITHPRTLTPAVETVGVRDATGALYVVRAPRDDAAGAGLMAEAALLRALADEELPFEVALPLGSVAIPDGPRAVVHRALEGEELDVVALLPGPGVAASLGEAIAALHERGWDAVSEAGLPVFDAEEVRTRLIAELDAMAESGRIPVVLLRRWESALENIPLWRFRATAVHGDLAGDRIRVSGEVVTAIEAFAEAHVGDPALDLAWLVASAPEDGLESVLESYLHHRDIGGDPGLLERAQLHSELALGRWLLHGIRLGDAAIIEEAEAMLADLAAAVGDSEDSPG